MSTDLLPCRHRGPRRRPEVFTCHSSKRVGLGLVTPEDCAGCLLRDHPEEAGPKTAPPHLFPCFHWGEEREAGCHACSHPRHGQTTWEACQTCPDYLFPYFNQHLPDKMVRLLIDKGPGPQADGWWHLPNVQRAYRRLARQFAKNVSAYPQDFSGRGIVMVGGGAYFPCAYVSLRVLRHVGCTLPVELWHLNGEMDERMEALLRPLGVRTVNADAVAQTKPFRFVAGHWWKGWQLKPYAIAHSGFEEVLFLDADCYPVRDPSFLFDAPQYREHGAVFWPDLIQSWFLAGPHIGKLFGVRLKNPPLESGQLLISKKSCWKELQLTLWYNAHAEFVYHHLWGDKDTFNIAWNLCGRKLALLWDQAGWDKHTILQHDAQGQVLFQHRCRDKFRLGAVDFRSSPQNHAQNEHNPRLAHEDFCFKVLEELRQFYQKDHSAS